MSGEANFPEIFALLYSGFGHYPIGGAVIGHIYAKYAGVRFADRPNRYLARTKGVAGEN